MTATDAWRISSTITPWLTAQRDHDVADRRPSDTHQLAHRRLVAALGQVTTWFSKGRNPPTEGRAPLSVTKRD